MQDKIPTFTPPSDGAPTFTPPSDGIPTFTPPTDAIPTFKAPQGPSCHFHSNEEAVARCARCGKPICQDCYDNYGVSGGEYAGEALCYDCCREMVADNVKQLTKNKNKIKFQFILSIIGMVVGFIFGVSLGASGGFGTAIVAGLFAACVGGVFLSAVKAYFSTLWETILTGLESGWLAAVIYGGIGSVVIAFKCIWTTISNTIYYIKYLKETSGFIQSDTEALAQMKDYMEYTLVRNQNKGVDIETLLANDGALAGNSYAKMVKTQGEEQAEANMRGCVASINENGEIIRSFAA